MQPLSPQERNFFQGHINLPIIGEKKQAELFNKNILLIGAGGLGSQLALLLGTSGVNLTIVDNDTVSTSNLLRQLAFTQADVGKPKAHTLAHAIKARNPLVKTQTRLMRADESFLQQELTNHYDLVLDATDNRAAKCAINSVCYTQQQPWISANALRTNGNIILFVPQIPNSPCYQCLYPNEERGLETGCSAQGVMNSLVACIASMQATLALQYLLSLQYEAHQLFSLDILTNDFLHTLVQKIPECPICSLRQKS